MTSKQWAVVFAAMLATGSIALWLAGRAAPDSGDSRRAAPAGGSDRGSASGGDDLKAAALPAMRGSPLREAAADVDRSATPPGALPGEAVLRFRDRAAMDAFLSRKRKPGIRVIGTLPELRSVRVRADSPGRLRELAEEEGIEPAANFAMAIPNPLPSRNAVESVDAQPVGVRSPELVGAATERGDWGEGVTVAVLDGRVGDHVTFQEGQVRLAPGWETGAAASELALGHGTGVASLIGGSHSQAPGIAPGATLLSFPVIDDQGFGDTFTTASAIVQAVDSGARVINVSLGTFSDSAVLAEAVAYAIGRNVAVVAAAGNEGVSAPAYPARYPGVIAVASVDALSQHLPFSNTGSAIDIAAPGYSVQVAWPDERLASVSGTSASTPLVSGAVAAVLSENPGITAIDAAALLMAHANEAGLPGNDEAYGAGVLNIRRVLTRNERGITDAAVASHVLQPTGVSGPSVLLVTVENRGTETLRGLQLESHAGNASRTFHIPSLTPGGVASRELPLTGHFGNPAESVRAASTLSLGGGANDLHPEDNRLETTVGGD